MNKEISKTIKPINPYDNKPPKSKKLFDQKQNVCFNPQGKVKEISENIKKLLKLERLTKK